MKVSNLFGDTQRSAISDADVVSQQLLVKAGYISQLSSGIYSYLPLAWRTLNKITEIIRTELNAIHGQEMNMPVIHPAEIWKQTGRWDSIDETMVRFRDRHNREMLLAMTHEEVVADLARQQIRSYKQLPACIYQFQTKFRDEFRPRAGLIRVREFIMKDSYTLDVDEDGLAKQYAAHYDAYFRIFNNSSLPVLAIGSDVGMMGGKVAHEFMYMSPIGEDSIAVCTQCDYAANAEVAGFTVENVEAHQEPRPIAKISTPNLRTINELAGFLGRSPADFMKSVIFTVDLGNNEKPKLAVCVVRGDMEVNIVQVKNILGARDLRPATSSEIAAAGLVAGFASPIGVPRGRATVIVDPTIAGTANYVAGANEPDYHFENVCCGRDFSPDIVHGIATVFEGALCVKCAHPLSIERGAEVGNIFQLGTRYTKALGANFIDETGASRPIVMGSYGIGLGRLMACIAEEHHDDKGLKWPLEVAPYHVNLVSLGKSDRVKEAAGRIYEDLWKHGIEVLYDDREVSAGVKFADADLRGMPYRLTVSERSLESGMVELKERNLTEFTAIAIDDIVNTIKDLVVTPS